MVCFAVDAAFGTSARPDYLRVRHTCHTIFLYHVKDHLLEYLSLVRRKVLVLFRDIGILARTSPRDLSDGNAFAILTDAC